MVLARDPPYGLQPSSLHQRSDRWQHPITRQILQILLALLGPPTGASLIHQNDRARPGATISDISVRCSDMISGLQKGRISPVLLPGAGQIAPKISADFVR